MVMEEVRIDSDNLVGSLSCLRWAFLMRELMVNPRLRSRVMVAPRNWNESMGEMGDPVRDDSGADSPTVLMSIICL